MDKGNKSLIDIIDTIKKINSNGTYSEEEVHFLEDWTNKTRQEFEVLINTEAEDQKTKMIALFAVALCDAEISLSLHRIRPFLSKVQEDIFKDFFPYANIGEA